MDKFQRVARLHQIFSEHRLPVSRDTLLAKLQCSLATLKRALIELRDDFGAPLVYDRQRNGYHYATEDGMRFQLPGLWFSADELRALLSMQQLLSGLEPGFLRTQLAPLQQRVEKLLEASHGGEAEAMKRIRIIAHTSRSGNACPYFQTVADALLRRKQMEIRYHARGADQESQRQISPQRLVHYRDNWYLDAWCHQRNALRSFALERLRHAILLDDTAQDIPEDELDRHFVEGYGIFAGEARHTAILRFTPERARWVSEENWHPRQQGRFLEDGRYELSFPYADSRELVMDILRQGAGVETIAPPELRQAVAAALRAALTQYTAPALPLAGEEGGEK